MSKLVDIIIDGSTVYCDLCNCDGDEKNDDGTPAHLGGGMISEMALCAECSLDEDIERKFDPMRSFGDNVRAYRREVNGTDANFTAIYTW
jgi:hypothetical protein